jgi:cupin fold WbuC family metalloprotein
MSVARALPPPPGAVVIVGREHVAQVLAAARASDRRRMILPFHKSPEDPLHRMFNALQPGTYVQPHRHVSPPKAEVFLVLAGCIDMIVFEEDGRIAEAHRLEAGGAKFAADVAAGLFHCFVARAPDTLIYEVKPGPYSALADKDFAPWAPPEGASEVDEYVARLERELAERFGLLTARP